MSLITEFVYLGQWSNYVEKLKLLEYELPQHVGAQGRLVYSTRIPLKVKVAHLFYNSGAKVSYKCQGCGNVFEVSYCSYNQNLSKLCVDCSKRSKKGQPHSKEWVENIAKGNRGNTRTPEQCKAMSENTKRLGWIGEAHPRYNSSLSRDHRERFRCYEAYYAWRKLVFLRDEFTCQICGTTGGYVQAHHIRNYSSNVELRTEVHNGITMCKRCHKLFHSTYGRTNNTLEQIQGFKLNHKDN